MSHVIILSLRIKEILCSPHIVLLTCWPENQCSRALLLHDGSTFASGGTYNDEKNLTSETLCKTCPVGYFCPEASVEPEDCPAGFWCTGGQSTGFQNACPIGTYSPEMNLHSM